MDKETRERYRTHVRDVKTAVFVAAWVREMFDALDGEIDRLEGIIRRMGERQQDDEPVRCLGCGGVDLEFGERITCRTCGKVHPW